MSPPPPVGSYPTFSPLPCRQGSRSLLRGQTFADFSYFRSAMPCAVRTFLIALRQRDRLAYSGAKIVKSWELKVKSLMFNVQSSSFWVSMAAPFLWATPVSGFECLAPFDGFAVSMASPFLKESRRGTIVQSFCLFLSSRLSRCKKSAESCFCAF